MTIQGTGYINPLHLNYLVQLSSFLHKMVTHHLTDKDKYYLLYSIPVQIIGSLVGALFSWWIYDSDFYFQPNSNYTIGQYFMAEVIFSSHIVLICIAIGQWAESRLIGLFAISGGITTGILTVGKLSGACLNPTSCIVINFVQAMRSINSKSLDHLWLYVFAPIIGAIIALILGVIIHPKPEKKKTQGRTIIDEEASESSPVKLVQ